MLPGVEETTTEESTWREKGLWQRVPKQFDNVGWGKPKQSEGG